MHKKISTIIVMTYNQNEYTKNLDVYIHLTLLLNFEKKQLNNTKIYTFNRENNNKKFIVGNTNSVSKSFFVLLLAIFLN